MHLSAFRPISTKLSKKFRSRTRFRWRGWCVTRPRGTSRTERKTEGVDAYRMIQRNGARIGSIDETYKEHR